MVIGSSNSGKSTIISSFSGCKTHGFNSFVEDKTNGKKIYVIASSPQENGYLTSQKLGQYLNTVTQNLNYIGCIIAIQPRRTRTRLSLEDIFQQVQNTRAFEIYAFIVDPPYRGKQMDRTDITARLAALGIVPVSLDGRKFALLNAIEIKRITRIP